MEKKFYAYVHVSKDCDSYKLLAIVPVNDLYEIHDFVKKLFPDVGCANLGIDYYTKEYPHIWVRRDDELYVSA